MDSYERIASLELAVSSAADVRSVFISGTFASESTESCTISDQKSNCDSTSDRNSSSEVGEM